MQKSWISPSHDKSISSFLGKTGAEYIAKRIITDVPPINYQPPNEMKMVEMVFVSMNLLIF